ncbi:hypothetical protein RvVAR0630_36420 [Agrobacterium vitis]|nr:hypothetical protein RvVAR0630_36420 [Agrobacterium vitis]
MYILEIESAVENYPPTENPDNRSLLIQAAYDEARRAAQIRMLDTMRNHLKHILYLTKCHSMK